MPAMAHRCQLALAGLLAAGGRLRTFTVTSIARMQRNQAAALSWHHSDSTGSTVLARTQIPASALMGGPYAAWGCGALQHAALPALARPRAVLEFPADTLATRAAQMQHPPPPPHLSAASPGELYLPRCGRTGLIRISAPCLLGSPFPGCSEIKERAKKAKADKAVQRAQAKAAGGKAVKNVPKGAGKAGAKSTGR